MVRIKDIPKVFIATFIAVELFAHMMPNSIKGMPDWIFFSAFVMSLAVGWVITTGLFKVVLWFLNRKG